VQNISKSFEKTVSILESTENSLARLAEMTEFLPITFYRGADLRDLDLADQDLRGLNFEGADFRNSNLKNIIVDQGALNGAKLSESYQWMQDEFDLYIKDVTAAYADAFYGFVRFRGSSLETAILQSGLTYRDLSRAASLNTQTLRKARRGDVVAMSSASAIGRVLVERYQEIKSDLFVYGQRPAYLQPMIEMLSINPAGGFQRVYRSDYVRLLAYIEITEPARDRIGSGWRDSPATLRWLRDSATYTEVS
jgi:hypothetical protein